MLQIRYRGDLGRLVLLGQAQHVSQLAEQRPAPGRNFVQRQCIKRKAAIWARRYAAMEPGERLAVLAALMAVEAE